MNSVFVLDSVNLRDEIRALFFGRPVLLSFKYAVD